MGRLASFQTMPVQLREGIEMAKPKVDPFTMEIIKDALIAIGDEMFVATQRTSMSTIIYEVLDYACAITDHSGDISAGQ